MSTITNAKAVLKKKPLNKKKLSSRIFIIVMLVYPIIHFLIAWLYINSSSIIYSFSRFDILQNKFIIDRPFYSQYRLLLTEFKLENRWRMLLNSLMYFPVTCGITLPLSIAFSYFLFKKVPGAGIFRVIFYLPSILPIAVLTMTFRFAFADNGIINPVLRNLGINPPYWFGTPNVTPIMIFVYCVWAGLGYNIVLLTGAMGRLPTDVMEYNKLEGVGYRRELLTIVVPMVWPNIVTLFIVGMTAVLTLYLQPYFLMGSSTEGQYHTGTISLYIFRSYSTAQSVPKLSAFGLLCSLIYVPFILIARVIMNKFFVDVDY